MNKEQATQVVLEIKNYLRTMNNTASYIEIHDAVLWSLLEEVAIDNFFMDSRHTLYELPVVMSHLKDKLYTIYSN